MVSKFHFIRIFSRVTGVTPGRFLSAVRLHEAKRLLQTTPLNVADISAQVGYSSTGTFTRRFSRSVGVPPTEYRRMGRGDAGPLTAGYARPSRPHGGRPHGSVAGRALIEGERRSTVYVGVFETPILQGPLVAWEATDDDGAFRLDGIPAGTWYLHAVAHGAHSPSAPHAGPPMLWDMAGPIEIGPGTGVRADLKARPLDWYRPPILLAFPEPDSTPVAA
ncbi:helix-turn-helix transcriptional regulator [Actinomadura sp. WMMB 499]|uniref:helix-turn-helix transcriptional regulator n=1 Tax=Actinomadura sp. WMMB 499 TaxID=1219491 RepID=UPI0020C7D326|nr:helix-turn-helix transcriptional regulator [Actinomadura sp. WMMB 499]